MSSLLFPQSKNNLIVVGASLAEFTASSLAKLRAFPLNHSIRRSYSGFSLFDYVLTFMASLIKKKKGNRLYYYLVESARVDGKPRIVHQAYLGTAENSLN